MLWNIVQVESCNALGCARPGGCRCDSTLGGRSTRQPSSRAERTASASCGRPPSQAGKEIWQKELHHHSMGPGGNDPHTSRTLSQHYTTLACPNLTHHIYYGTSTC